MPHPLHSSRRRTCVGLAALLLAAGLAPGALASDRPGKVPPGENKHRPAGAGDGKHQPAASGAAAGAGPVRQRLRQHLQERKAAETPETLRARIARARLKAPPAPKECRGRKLGPGADLAGLDLRKVVWHGIDLRGAKLAGANLAGAWLVDANLEGADLAGAILDGALLDGAKFKDACLFSASVKGSSGLLARGARPHPFFVATPGAPVGEISYLSLGAPRQLDPEFPRQPMRLGNGRIYWFSHGEGQLEALAPFGINQMFQLPLRVDAPSAGTGGLRQMARDERGRLWMFGDHAYFVLHGKDQQADQAEGELRTLENAMPFPLALRQVLALPRNGIQLTTEELVMNLSFKGNQPDFSAIVGKGILATAGNRSGSVRYWALEGSPVLVAGASPGEPAWTVPLPKGSRVAAMVAGPGDTVWAALAGADALLVLGGQPSRCRTIALPHTLPDGAPLQRGNMGVHALVLGPDGNMWYTAPTAHRIGRCTPAGEVTEFPLPKGALPLDLSASDDGSLLFSIVGRNAIGSIRALPGPRPEAALEGAAAEPPASGETKAAPGGASAQDSVPSATEEAAATFVEASAAAAGGKLRKQRQRARRAETLVAGTDWNQIEAAAETLTAAESAEERQSLEELIAWYTREPFKGGGAASAQPAAPGDGKASAPGAAGAAVPKAAGAGTTTSGAAGPETKLDPAASLYDRGVTLTRGATAHILGRHGSDASGHGSRFAGDCADAEALEALLARGLEAAGGLGRTFDRRGRRYTYCPLAGAGYTWSADGWRETDRFVIISLDRWNPEERLTEHVVLSAFPCSRGY